MLNCPGMVLMTSEREFSTSGIVWSHPSYHLDWNGLLLNCRLGKATRRIDASQDSQSSTSACRPEPAANSGEFCGEFPANYATSRGK